MMLHRMVRNQQPLLCYERVRGNSVSIGMKTVVPNHQNKGIYERIETNKSNKFSNSGMNKSEEEEAPKDQDSREINTNSSSSNDKTKSGEYVLNRLPKKPRGGEVYDNNTATTISCGIASEQENICKITTNMLEKVKVPNIVRMEKESNQDAIEPLP